MSIRLTEERWIHVTEEHSEMAGYYFKFLETIEEPEAIYEGKMGECIAVREIEEGEIVGITVLNASKRKGYGNGV